MEDPAALETTWLVVVLLALALIFIAYRWQQGRRQRARPEAQITPSDQAQELDRLGLSAVRPRGAAPPEEAHGEEPVELIHEALGRGKAASIRRAEPVVPSEEPPSSGDAFDGDAFAEDRFAEDRFAEDAFDDVGFDEAVVFDDTGVSAPRPVPAPPSETPPAPPPEAPAPAPTPYLAMRSPLWHAADPDAVGLLLESLCASLGAQSVALLRYHEAHDTYAVDALVGHRLPPETPPFAAEGNALDRVPDDRSISILEADALAALRYHPDPASAVGHAAALTVEGPDERVLLVADGAPGSAPFSARHLALLGDYADLLGRLLAGDAPGEPDEALEDGGPLEAEPPETTESDEAEPDEPEPDEEEPLVPDEEPVRPRADIIAEEMAAARHSERPLALALVVLRDTEAIEARGRAAVAEAERALFARLRRIEGSARVERFGELLAGVFCHAGPTFVEAWAERLAAAGPMVHVGVALLRARHLDAEALRADAAAALRAAYERGEDCVILE